MMPSKSDEITVKLTGTGLSFDRKVSEEAASKIITFIIGGGTGTLGGGTPSAANPGAAQPNALLGAAASGMTPKQFFSGEEARHRLRTGRLPGLLPHQCAQHAAFQDGGYLEDCDGGGVQILERRDLRPPRVCHVQVLGTGGWRQEADHSPR
ncbi:MAG TPA: hypothetical protein VGU20_17380 [Stellaceae bacterium]|nr:hypothetical protein [Stellaceae bacterium]